jgi:hypothetical protein
VRGPFNRGRLYQGGELPQPRFRLRERDAFLDYQDRVRLPGLVGNWASVAKVVRIIDDAPGGLQALLMVEEQAA